MPLANKISAWLAATFGPREKPRKLDLDQQIEHHLNRRLAQLSALLNPSDQPNINKLWEIAKDLDFIRLNIKSLGYDLAQQLASVLPVRTGLSPMRIDLTSKPSTQADMQSDWAAYWAGELKLPVIFHRKLWEFVFLLQALWENDCIVEGKSGVGFGCGSEPIPSYLASHGVKVMATDLSPQNETVQHWHVGNQHASSRDVVFRPQLVSREIFDRQVELSYVDMRAIPAELRDYDFCWSLCAMEHLGSIKDGLDFVRDSLGVLKPGGVAVHTTEFNFANDTETIDNWPTVLFQKQHFADLAEALRKEGHGVAPLDFGVGGDVLDRFIDLPPYAHDLVHLDHLKWLPEPLHLKVAIDGFATTCYGLIIQKASSA